MKSSERHVQTLFQCLKNLFKCLNMDLGPVPITLIAKAKVNSMCSTTYFSHKRAAWVLLGNLSEKALAQIRANPHTGSTTTFLSAT